MICAFLEASQRHMISRWTQLGKTWTKAKIVFFSGVLVAYFATFRHEICWWFGVSRASQKDIIRKVPKAIGGRRSRKKLCFRGSMRIQSSIYRIFAILQAFRKHITSRWTQVEKEPRKIENCLVYFSKVSERTLSIFGGLFCYLSGRKLGGALLFRKRPKSIS